jgi:hypothetical protein
MGEVGVEHACGSWRVTWRRDEFQIPDIGAFNFKRIVLPIEIGNGFLALRLESGFRFAILHGSPLADLEVFKRRASAEILAAAGKPFYCANCAADAGMTPRLSNGSICPGCRESYCRNPKCLRRLERKSACKCSIAPAEVRA